ncbi:MAG: cupin domain-containing protein [Elainella sp. Prado103]|nr:cupin domain-containing protein [Elainella sp. Prado103]
MLIRKLQNCPEFVAGDATLLRELLHPDKQAIDLRYSLAHAVLQPGQTSKPHTLKTSEVYYVLSGTGEMHIDAEIACINAGDAVYIPPLARQFVCCTSTVPLVFLCIVDPAWRAEDERVETEV